MAVTSVRFNKKEEETLNYLKNQLHCDTSEIIKMSLHEMYEYIKDKEIISDFESKNEKRKSKLYTFNNIIK